MAGSGWPFFFVMTSRPYKQGSKAGPGVAVVISKRSGSTRPSEVTMSAHTSYRLPNRKPAGVAVIIWCLTRSVFRPLASIRNWATKYLPCWTSICAPIGSIFCTNGYGDTRWITGVDQDRCGNLLERNERERTVCLEQRGHPPYQGGKRGG